MNKLVRNFTSTILAVIVISALFFFIRLLTSAENVSVETSNSNNVIDFVRIQSESVTQKKSRLLPKKPPELPSEPVTPTVQPIRAESVEIMNVEAALPNLKTSLETIPFSANYIPDATETSEVIPIFRVEPQYPPRAYNRGIEGWVKVEFDISETGSVENIRIIDSKPRNIFNRYVIKALKKFRFRPKIVDGVAVKQSSSQFFEFKLI
ncbi:MAG: TonB family protein [Candidatus Scalindua sp.]